MRLTMMWSPIFTVFSIEPLGITRACTRVPSMKMKARITQNHETTSRQTRCCAVAGARCGDFSPDLPAALACRASAFTMRLHFQLHELRGICARVACRAEFSFGIAHRRAQRFERKISERIGAQELANFLGRMSRGDQLLAARRIDAVVARRNRRRAADAHVNFGCARLANQA